MPRTGRGGSRQGTPGKAYAQRADLQQAKLPIQTVPDQPYGEAGAQQAAQQAMPLAPPPTAGPPPGQPQGQPQPGPPAGPMPGELGALTGPTQRPDEHLMTGAPSGPGPGPEVLTMNQRSGLLADQLDQMAKVSGNTDLQVLASRARQLGQ